MKKRKVYKTVQYVDDEGFLVEKEEETYETYEEEVVKREEKPKAKVKEKAK